MSYAKVGIIIGFAVSLLLIGILLPIGVNSLTGWTGNYSYGTVSGTNTTVGTLVNTILPVLIVVGLILGFVGSSRRNGGEYN